jgi:hypothetical protein
MKPFEVTYTDSQGNTENNVIMYASSALELKSLLLSQGCKDIRIN